MGVVTSRGHGDDVLTDSLMAFILSHKHGMAPDLNGSVDAAPHAVSEVMGVDGGDGSVEFIGVGADDGIWGRAVPCAKDQPFDWHDWGARDDRWEVPENPCEGVGKGSGAIDGDRDVGGTVGEVSTGCFHWVTFGDVGHRSGHINGVAWSINVKEGVGIVDSRKSLELVLESQLLSFTQVHTKLADARVELDIGGHVEVGQLTLKLYVGWVEIVFECLVFVRAVNKMHQADGESGNLGLVAFASAHLDGVAHKEATKLSFV